MVVGIFWCCVILSLQQNGGTYKKTGNVVVFPNVAFVPLHRINRDEHFLWVTFENQRSKFGGGGGRFDFHVDGEKRAQQC